VIDTMSSPKKAPRKKSPRDMTADELMKEINKLNSLLQDKLKIERDTEEEEYQALLRKMAGRTIQITLKDDPLYGMEAVITGPRGKSKKPMYWWFRTTTGVEAYKSKTSFKLLPLESTSEEA